MPRDLSAGGSGGSGSSGSSGSSDKFDSSASVPPPIVGDPNPGFLRAQNMSGSEMWFRVRGAGGKSENTRVSAPGFSGDEGLLTAKDYCERRAWEANDAGTFLVVKGTLGIFP